MTHRFDVRVYYEDTDMAGIVYHANHLRFIERARTEFVRARGIDQAHLKATEGIVFAVSRLVADYRAPARFDDMLTVRTTPLRMTGARAVLSQRIVRGEAPIFDAEVTLVALGRGGGPVRMPAALRMALNPQVAKTRP